MRKRRALLYDDDTAVLNLLTQFFEDRGYEVLAFGEPTDCPIYEERERCDQGRPCGDIMITDLKMPRMSGLELLKLQAKRGCSLSSRNKALLTGSLDRSTLEAVRELGCAIFMKPCRLGVLAEWVAACESRMELSLPLAVRRREHREPCRTFAVMNVGPGTDEHVVEVLNRSGSGLCVRAGAPLNLAEILTLKTWQPLASDRLQVRWTRPDCGGACFAGMACC